MSFETQQELEEISLRRKKRIEEMKRQKMQQQMRRKMMLPIAVLAAVIAVVLVIVAVVIPDDKQGEEKVDIKEEQVQEEQTQEEPISSEQVSSDAQVQTEVAASHDKAHNVKILMTAAMGCDIEVLNKYTAVATEIIAENSKQILSATATNATKSFNGEIVSASGVLIDVEAGKILAQRDPGAIIHPASMTKILTVLVAAEHLESMEQLNDKFTIGIDITDYSYVNDCSNTGFLVDEQVTVKDMFYGTILPSGADSALGLAIYTAGSQEAFVEMMNAKLTELGLSETAHFTNCIGIYDSNHYCTVYDMAVILKAAYDNELCREVLSTHSYTTSSTSQHPEGITVSNWFLRRIEDSDCHGKVLCAKTGYVNEAGSCAASLAIGNDGKEYICVTVNSSSSWRCIYDHVALYQQFL